MAIIGKYPIKDSSEPIQTAPDLATEIEAESVRFTKRWSHYGIVMDGDVSNDPSYPDACRKDGFSIGHGAEQALITMLHADKPADERRFLMSEDPAVQGI